MDSEIDAAIEQRFFNFFCEQSLAADLIQGHVENLVALGVNDLNPRFHAAGFQTVFDVVCLPERQLRAP